MNEATYNQFDQERAMYAETKSGQWLADGNEWNDKGNKAKAEKCYAKAQYWLDRFNKITGRA